MISRHNFFKILIPWEANRFSAKQEIPHILRNPNVHYRIYTFTLPTLMFWPSQLPFMCSSGFRHYTNDRKEKIPTLRQTFEFQGRMKTVKWRLRIHGVQNPLILHTGTHLENYTASLSGDQYLHIHCFLFLWRLQPNRGLWSPHSWGFRDHTQRHTTVGRTPLDEWSARRRNLYLTTHNSHNRQHIHVRGGIRTHNLSRRAAADLRLRPRGHWDRIFRVSPT